MKQLKYFGSWITEDGYCETDTKTRIAVSDRKMQHYRERIDTIIRCDIK